MLSQESLQAIEKEKAKYPKEQAISAVMAALRIAQEEKGWLSTETMDYIADYLKVQPIQVYEVATFYTMYDLKPVGKYKLEVCGSISCWLCGCDQLIEYLSGKLGVQPGETTPDGKFTLKEVECLGACIGAPMMQIGKNYYENLSPERVDKILDSLE